MYRLEVSTRTPKRGLRDVRRVTCLTCLLESFAFADLWLRWMGRPTMLGHSVAKEPIRRRCLVSVAIAAS